MPKEAFFLFFPIFFFLATVIKPAHIMHQGSQISWAI